MTRSHFGGLARALADSADTSPNPEAQRLVRKADKLRGAFGLQLQADPKGTNTKLLAFMSNSTEVSGSAPAPALPVSVLLASAEALLQASDGVMGAMLDDTLRGALVVAVESQCTADVRAANSAKQVLGTNGNVNSNANVAVALSAGELVTLARTVDRLDLPQTSFSALRARLDSVFAPDTGTAMRTLSPADLQAFLATGFAPM